MPYPVETNGVNFASVSPPGYMFYWPDDPREHTYIIEATANGRPVGDFTLFVEDEISQLTADPPSEQRLSSNENLADDLLGTTLVLDEQNNTDENKVTYTAQAGLPKLNPSVSTPVAAPKSIRFRAEKTDYKASSRLTEAVYVLGDVNAGGAPEIISVPMVNYTVLHDPPGDNSYAYLDDSMTLKGIVNGLTLGARREAGAVAKGIPVYPSPWSSERSFDLERGRTDLEVPEETDISDFQDLEKTGLLQPRRPTPAAGAFTIAAALEAASGTLVVASGPLAFGVQLIKFPILAVSLDISFAVLTNEELNR